MTPTSSVKPWLPVLFFSIVILLFLPTFFTTTYSRPQSPAAVKRGWDAFYLAFVLFAVICGFLGRRSPENDSGNPSMGSNSFAFSGRYNVGQTVGEANQNTGVHRIRSSGSNPDLNHNAAALWGGSISTVDEWRYYDVSQLYRPRPESEIPESRSFWLPETKMVPADNPVSLPNLSLGFRSTPMPWMRSTDEISDDPVGKDAIFGLENPREPTLPEAPQMQPHYQRRTLEKLPATEMELSTKFTKEMPLQLPVEPAPAVTRRCTRNLEQLPDTKAEQDSDDMPEMPFLPLQEPAPETFQAMLSHRRRRSSEKIGDKEMEANFTPQTPRLSTLETATLQHPRTRNLEKHLPEMPRVPPLEPVQATMRHRRSLDELPDAKAEQDDNFACEMRHPSQPAPAPIPAMSSRHRSRVREDIRRRLAEQGAILEEEEPNALPLPPPQPPQEDEEKQRSSVGGEKDIAVLPADKMKKKKKGSKTKLQQDEAAFNFSSTSSHPEPSSPPPLTSVIHQLFSKRGGSKRRSAQAPATTTPPPQPPPQPSVQRREKQPESAPSLPPPLHSKRQALEPPPTLPPSSAPLVQHYRKKEASDVSRVLQPSPSPPRAPRPPPPPPPMQGSDPPHQVISEERAVAASNSSSAETTAGMSAAFCSSPDVNNKFDQFIAQFHANLQMERINSMREKQRRPRKRQ